MILPPWAVFRSVPPAADSAYMIYQHLISQSTNGKQDVLKQPEANTDLLYFTALTYYKSYVEKTFPIFAIAFSH